MRLAAALGIIAICAAAGLYIYQRHVNATIHVANYNSQSNNASLFATATTTAIVRKHPSWEDPVALLIAFGGLAVAAAVLNARRQPATA